ncbi:hypothetical protein LG943_20270 [Streptomonospora sp. S1-112]|uniref:Uncharacterized protein n=1 Tax=Streptomonospora mangrovi TaxID=2883123 RepID=A0A9X3NQQ5_9ACTN|nr:hypothetical protein [Streptomonospora mangrovi]MDA0566628.1 hypothetical protein [Streptomonospora mangrovi]
MTSADRPAAPPPTAPGPTPAPASPASPARPIRTLAAVAATALVCLPAGVVIGMGDLPVVDLNLFTEEVQRLSSADAGVRYDPDTPGSGADPMPVEAVLLRHPVIGGDDYTLRLGHDADSYFHEVRPPVGTGNDGAPVRIDRVDWGADRITVTFTSGYRLGVDTEQVTGLR